MNWDAIGAVGEIIGALAVFLTLIYLSIQIRQNTKAVQASSMDSAISHVNQARHAVYSDPEMANLYYRGNSDPHLLNDEEKIRYRLLVHNILLVQSNVLYQSELTNLSKSNWEAQLAIIDRVASSPGGRWFWDNHGYEFEESFRLKVDAMLKVD